MSMTLIIWLTCFSVIGSIDDFHCKVPSCRDFYYYYKSKSLPSYQVEYLENVCFDSVFSIQKISKIRGSCVTNNKLNPICIIDIAKVIRYCSAQLALYEKSEQVRHYFCGYSLMKYCSIHIGLSNQGQIHRTLPPG